MKILIYFLLFFIQSCNSQNENGLVNDIPFQENRIEEQEVGEGTEGYWMEGTGDYDTPIDYGAALVFKEKIQDTPDLFSLTIDLEYPDSMHTVHICYKGKEAGGFDRDSNLIVIDSLQTIKALFECAKWQMDQLREQEKRADERYGKLYNWIKKSGLLKEEEIINNPKKNEL